jgi:hypothetical protein
VHVFHLLKDGKLPVKLIRPEAVAERNPSFTQPGADAAALWGYHDEKLVWTEGKVTAFDLAADPGELYPLDPAGHPLRPELDGLVDAMGRTSDLPTEPVDMEDALRAVGYVE